MKHKRLKRQRKEDSHPLGVKISLFALLVNKDTLVNKNVKKKTLACEVCGIAGNLNRKNTAVSNV